MSRGADEARSWRSVVGIGGRLSVVLTVFLAHFRPWQGGLLEEWGFALAWQSEGWAGFVPRLRLTAGRPLHLLPHYVGLAASSGGFVGEYAVLAGLAIAQLLLAAWALRTLVPSAALRWALAVAVALHPWWPAGGVLRYLPAQFAVTLTLLWFGLAIRYLQRGPRRLVAFSAAALLLGLLAYQALLVAVLVIVVPLAVLLTSDRRRRLLAVGSTAVVVALDVVYTVTLAPIISPESYEASISGSQIAPLQLARAIVRTVVHTPPLWGMLALTLVVVAVFVGLTRPSPGARWTVWLGLALIAAPGAGLAYAANAAHLNDAERIALPIGAVAWVVLCLAASLVGEASLRRLRGGAAGVVLALTGAMTVAWYSTWTGYAASQADLLAVVGPIRAETATEDIVVVVDETGSYGDVYTLLPPYLDIALAVEGYGAGAVICTPDDVERNQPTAAKFPIPTTPSCTDVTGIDGAEDVAEFEVPGGTIEILTIDN